MAGRLNAFRRCPCSMDRSGPTRVDGVVPAVVIPREAPRQSDCRGEPPKAEKGENRIHWRTSVFKLLGTTAERPIIGSAGTWPARTHRHQLIFRQSGPAPHIRVWLGRHDFCLYGVMAIPRSVTRPLSPLALPPMDAISPAIRPCSPRLPCGNCLTGKTGSKLGTRACTQESLPGRKSVVDPIGVSADGSHATPPLQVADAILNKTTAGHNLSISIGIRECAAWRCFRHGAPCRSQEAHRCSLSRFALQSGVSG